MTLDPDVSGGPERALAVIGAAAILLVLPLEVVAGDVAPWMPVVILMATVLVYVRRDSPHGLIALAVVALSWLVASPDRLTAWTMVVAVLLFTAHTTLAMRTSAPPSAEFGRAVVLRWLGRWAAVVLVTVAVFGLAYAVKNLHRSDGEAVLALTLVLLGALVLLLRAETLDEGTPGADDGSVRASRRVRGRAGVSGDPTEYRERDPNHGRGWL